MVGALAFALASGIVIWLLFGPGAISAPAELAAPSVAAVADGAPKPTAGVANAAAAKAAVDEPAPNSATEATVAEAGVATEAGVDSEATNASA